MLGLTGNVLTWPTLLQKQTPMVIPIMPGTFRRPSDWHDNIVCSDFIFLTSPAPRQQASSSREVTQEGEDVLLGGVAFQRSQPCGVDNGKGELSAGHRWAPDQLRTAQCCESAECV